MPPNRPGWPETLNTSLAGLSFEVGSRQNLVPLRRAYCVGMAGSGMKGIAEFLQATGWAVSGSDRNPAAALIEQFRDLGITLHTGHAAAQLPPQLDLLIHSPAIGADNPERREAQLRGVPELTYPQALGQVMQGREGYSVTGTHGKSTTTALLGHLLQSAGLEPSILCGAEMIGPARNGVAGPGRPIVVESCEYRGHFLSLAPRVIGLLGIEPDHFDCFPTIADAVTTYREFVSRLPVKGLLVSNLDCEWSQTVAPSTRARRITVSATDLAADFSADHVRTSSEGLALRIHERHSHPLEVVCPLWGNHHAINVLTAYAMAREAGCSRDQIAAGLRTFPGIRRRFEVRRESNGVTWIDDYAHHPSAVRTLIDAARDRYPGRRIWCLFQPHQVSRTRILAADFATALAAADEVALLPVFGAREADTVAARELSVGIAAAVNLHGGAATFLPSLDLLPEVVETRTSPGDVVLMVGAGDIDRVQHGFTGRLRRHHAS